MRLVFIADIQGNAVALEAILAELNDLSIDQFICLGDVASGPEPNRVLELLRQHHALTIRGNMDDVILRPQPYQGDDAIAQRYAEMDRWCADQLQAADRIYLESFSNHLTLNLPNGQQLLACHGSPTSNLDVWTATEPQDDILKSHFAEYAVQWIAVGHMHQPLLRCLANYRLFNPGSVGLPPVNPTSGRHPLTADYAILEWVDNQIILRFGQVAYRGDVFKARVLATAMPHAAWFASLWED